MNMQHAQQKTQVLLGMSGGVDSSLAAALLVEQGYEVVGCFIKNWSDTKNADGVCDWKAERRDALAVAARLGIPLVTVDSEAQYRASVVEYLYQEYAAGRTPNPDIRCNELIKFPVLAAEADRLGVTWIATGHYAQVRHDNDASHLLCAADAEKDQTYFLSRVRQEHLRRTLFPIGHLTKTQVREEARKRDIQTAEKKESMGICFIGKTDMRDFLRQRIPDAPGDIVTSNGTVVGTHPGVHHFTIGQRHGLEVGGGAPYYVIGKDVYKRQVIVSADTGDVETDRFTVADVQWIAGDPIVGAYGHTPLHVRIRHRQPMVSATLTVISVPPAAGGIQKTGSLNVHTTVPIRAVTPGQEAVFYRDGECLGSGVIV